MSDTRLPVLDYFIMMARLVSLRGTCSRRKVGCVLVDDQRRVLATGYNGVPRRVPHCSDPDSTCYGGKFSSGQGLNVCQAVHAEQNAIAQCRDTDAVCMAFVTVTPCMSCAKLLMNTGMRTLVAWEPYAHDHDTIPLLEAAGKKVIVYTAEERRAAMARVTKDLGVMGTYFTTV